MRTDASTQVSTVILAENVDTSHREGLEMNHLDVTPAVMEVLAN